MLSADAQVARSAWGIRGNFAWALLGNGLFQACRFGVIVVLAKLTTPDFVGRYDFASSALAAPVVLFLGLEVRHVCVADARGELPFGAYRAVRLIGMLLATLVLAAACLWREPDVTGPFFWLMFGVCAARVVYHAAEVDWALYQRRERIDWLAITNALRGVILLALFAAILLVARGAGLDAADPLGIAWSVAIAALSVTVAWWLIWRTYDRPRLRDLPEWSAPWTWAQAARAARDALPLGAVILIISLCDSVPRWIIQDAGGNDALGFFGALKYISMTASFIVIQLGTAASNRLAGQYQHDRPAFIRLAARISLFTLALAGLLVAIAWLLAEPLLRLLLDPQYARYAPEFVVLMAGQAVLMLGSVFGFVTTTMRRFWIQVPIQLAILAATSAAAWAWIPDDPVRGGAWTTVVRAAAQTGLYAICLWAGLRYAPNPPQTVPGSENAATQAAVDPGRE